MKDAPPEGARGDNTREAMQRIARAVDDLLPQGWGFFVMAFPFAEGPGRMNYVSNAQRGDVLTLMQEFLLKQNAQNFATHSVDSKVYKALEESVKLQSFYASLLNQYDGGERKQFATPVEWIKLLHETGTLK